MKKTIWLLLTTIVVLMFSCKSNSVTNNNKCGLIDSSTIILSVIYPDTKNHIENDLIIFAIIKNGEYIPIDDYDDKNRKDINERDSILRDVKTFYTLKNGNSIKVDIDSVVKSLYDCNDLRAGRLSSKYRLQNISIASNFKLPNNKQFEEVDNKSNDSLFYKVINDSIFQGIRDKYQKIDFKIVKLIDSDKFLCIANAEDSTNAISNLYFLDNSCDSIKLIDLIPEELGLDSWGSGNEFLDYRDIDNDNQPEIFILYHGYEWTTMIVYKKVGNKYVKKLENTIFGC